MAVERFIGGPYHGKCQQTEGEPEDFILVPCSPQQPDTLVALYARDGRTGDQVLRGYRTQRDNGHG